ncbi:MAG: hypothetical protein EZS28_043530 [Streblomastix strix]|uniref:SPRY domain-containing protein n=1 Tax=Streblomastix strix TaxID=222440 RepID=A0A5J4TSP2_9EUKA|nr:MAG: hypothetical protein EZS28_043530 [Streblomastix strix]
MKENNEKCKLQLFGGREIPIDIIKTDPPNFDLVDIDGKQKKIVKEGNDWRAASLTQVLEEGIFELNSEFNNTNENYLAIGIVKDSYVIPAQNPGSNPSLENIAIFTGSDWSSPIFCKGNGKEDNPRIKNNQKIKLKYDSNEGTLILFIDGVQQPAYITGIKEKVRFIIVLYTSGSSCTIHSLKKLKAPTSQHIANEIAIQW